MVSEAQAEAFATYCRQNAQACPVLPQSAPGDPHLPRLGDIDIRTDLLRYRGYRDGALSEMPTRLRLLESMTAVVVASRRTVPPFGLHGGQDGAPGRQWVLRADGTRHDMTGNDQAELRPGDARVIQTPGGGGYG